MSRPGRCGLLAPAHPPGATRKVGRSTTGRSSGVSLRSTYTSPVVPEGSAGDARCGPVAGCPAPLPSAPPPVARRRCPPTRSGRCPTSVPEAGPCPVARPSGLAPFTLTRLPVPTPMAPPIRWSTGAVGVLPWPRPVPRCPWPPASRRLGAPKRAPPLAAPVARCSSLRSVASRPVRSRLRLVSQSRFPPRSARRRRSEDSVIRPRLACAPRYDGYIRGCITPGQEVFLNPQGYPRNFFVNPQNSSVVHRRPPFVHRDFPRSLPTGARDRCR